MRLFSLSILLLALALVGCKSESSAPRAVFNVRDYGAVGDGTNTDTAAFQKALDTCAQSGRGEVLVPAGSYLIGSVQMGSHTTIKLAQDSFIIGTSNMDDYPMTAIRW